MRNKVVSLLLGIGLFLIGRHMLAVRQSARVNHEVMISYAHRLQEVSQKEEVLITQEGADTEMDSVKNVVGILNIPSIDLTYPIMKAEDNDYYLTHDPHGNESSYGAIFWDYKNRPLIFGHNMKDGRMFGKLKDVKGGDMVLIDQKRYQVIGMEVRAAEEVMTIETLTLVTCQGEKRLVVYLQE